MDSHADLLKIYIDTYYRLFLTGAAARREVALVVASEGLDVGLVHRAPALHPVAEAPEAHVCECSEIIAACLPMLDTVSSISG